MIGLLLLQVLDIPCGTLRVDPSTRSATCVEAKPSPSPAPQPSPTPSPTPTPKPTPDEAFYRMGVKLHNVRDTTGACKKQNPPCLGKVFLFNSTPKSLRPYCDHRPDDPDECELKTEWQGKIPGSGWADVWMKHPSWGNTWEPMDHATGPDGKPHPFITHHKPYVHQTGRTEVLSCPQGLKPPHPKDPPHPKCSLIVENIGAAGRSLSLAAEPEDEHDSWFGRLFHPFKWFVRGVKSLLDWIF